MKFWHTFVPLVLILLMACSTPDDVPTAVPVTTISQGEDAPTDTPEPTRIEATDTAVPIIDPTDTPEPTDTPQPTAIPTPFTWPDALPAKANLSRDPIAAAEQTTLADLNSNQPLERDDVALAIAYKGLKEIPSLTGETVTEPLAVNTRQQINIFNIDSNIVNNVEMTLLAVSEHAYFWFDTTAGLTWPEKAVLDETAVAFDQIYEQNRAIFGSENNPGIDGDPRVHIMNASPLTVCDVDEVTAHQCGLGGYYASSNTLPLSVDEQSNEREMFIMNGNLFGGNRYLDVLAHEFRHMIEDNYDANDFDWEVEGSAMLAEDLIGFPNDPIARANQFLQDTDQQLNRWSDGNTTPYYGQGYLLNRYIYDRLGSELYLEFATHPDHGLAAIDDLAAQHNLNFNGISLWLDWLTALAIHAEPGAPAEYALREGIETAAYESINSFPMNLEETVSQYAADYYQLSGNDTVTLNFTGSNHTQLLKVLPASGEHMWLANRANYSQMRLTREFDLTSVATATFNYAVFHEIEEGYDFAYLTISTDGGQTWQGLEAENMQGLNEVDDPSDSAFTERFYTNNSIDWVEETADLTPYAGQIIQIRFEYITDPILTFGGLAVDKISIPEIGFYDGAEEDMGWTAEGFVRATGYVPQQWHVQLITFVDGAPVVQHVLINEDNTASIEISLAAGGGKRPYLIIAATAPMTLEPAYYQLELQ